MCRILFLMVALISMPAMCQDAPPKSEGRKTDAAQADSEKPFKIIDRHWTVDSIDAAWKEHGSRAWAEGDVLNFIRQSSADKVMLMGSIQAPMRLVEGTKSWTLSVEIPQLSNAVIGYGFLEGQSSSLVDSDSWRGADAPAAATESAGLDGKIINHELWIEGLKENRKVRVYLPPGHDPNQEHAVIYMGDGHGVERYARMMEPLIDSGEIPKAMIVGVHSGGYRGERNEPHRMENDFRAIEYLVGAEEMLREDLVHQRHFDQHERFFTETVRQWAEREYGASTKRNERGLFGVSNGAAFCVTMAQRHPDLYGFVLPFSFTWDKAAQKPDWRPDQAPRHFLVAGILEPKVHQITKDYARLLKSAGYPAVFHDRLSGHDALMWREEFVNALVWALDHDQG